MTVMGPRYDPILVQGLTIPLDQAPKKE